MCDKGLIVYGGSGFITGEEGLKSACPVDPLPQLKIP